MDVRKKKFTEHQLDRSQQRRDENDYKWDGDDAVAGGGGGVGGQTRDYHRKNEDCYDSHVE